MFLFEQFWLSLCLWIIAIVGIPVYIHIRANNPNIVNDARIIFIKKYWRVFMLSIIGFIILFKISFSSIEMYNKWQKAINYGIYEIEYSIGYYDGLLKVYYMICDPTDDPTKLLAFVEDYFEKENILDTIIKKYTEKNAQPNDCLIVIKFYRATDEQPPGWQPSDVFLGTHEFDIDYDHFTYNNHIFTIKIPNGTLSKDDYIYYAGYQDEGGVTEYKRVTQEDGSFILVPVE